ncbi:tyrosine recombinase XerC [Dactylosporangium sp. NPDC048998]|uniref:site-specific integrase n=1 Tax=Dactylosporangium sp. NPDC048998 TaxID=3363976 RepID=UPI00371D869E
MASRARANGEGSIYPYRNGFAAYVWVTKPDGKRGRKYVYGKTREEVHDKWVKLHAKANDGPVATKTPTIGSYAAYWLEEIVKPNLSPGTYVAYEVACRLYIVPGLGKKKLNLPSRDAQTWINEVARTCQCCAQGRDARRPKGKRRCCALGRCCRSLLSPASLGHIRRTLRSMLGQAIVEDSATRNVAKHLRLPVSRPARRSSWSTDEARRFLESARQDGDPLYAAYVLVLVLGLRKGEMLGLTDDAIDWAGWDRRCKPHRVAFCVECVAEYEVTLQIDRQLQRIGNELLYRETKTPLSDAGLPCRRSVRSRFGSVTSTPNGTARRLASCGTGCGYCSPPGSGRRSSRGTSIGTGIDARAIASSIGEALSRGFVRRGGLVEAAEAGETVSVIMEFSTPRDLARTSPADGIIPHPRTVCHRARRGLRACPHHRW